MSQPPSLGEAIRDALPTYAAPESLQQWAREQGRDIRRRPAPRRSAVLLRKLSYAAGLVLALGLGWTGSGIVHNSRIASRDATEVASSLVDMHVRSLMADHLTDVRSSDRHTVKPWFAGKIDFAPQVPDLAAVGFPLLGGRAEYVAGHQAAALVYGRRGHVINLFIWPTAVATEGVSSRSVNGFALVHWVEGGLSHWAVSDAAAAEVLAFTHAYEDSKR